MAPGYPPPLELADGSLLFASDNPGVPSGFARSLEGNAKLIPNLGPIQFIRYHFLSEHAISPKG